MDHLIERLELILSHYQVDEFERLRGIVLSELGKPDVPIMRQVALHNILSHIDHVKYSHERLNAHLEAFKIL